MINPLAQFIIKPILTFNICSYKIEITNSTITLFIAYLIIFVLAKIVTYKISLIPSKIQSFGEIFFQFIDNMLISTAGKNSKKYFSLIFSTFVFIATNNMIGMIPYAFTTTSHIAVTFALSIFVFSIITIIGFINHGLSYFFILLPRGTPNLLAPLIIFIELFAYLARPISLSIRLAANMTGGHVVLKVLAYFAMISGLFGIMPLILLTMLTIFEIFISILQAYIFSILICSYLGNALNLH